MAAPESRMAGLPDPDTTAHADGSVSMYSSSGHMGGDDDPTTDYDEGAIRFGRMDQNTTDFTMMYSTSTGAMSRDLDDPYAFEKKPMHYIPGYTGHLPLNRERFGINYREASADTIATQIKKGVHNPVTPLNRPPPNYFGNSKAKPLNRSQKFVAADQVAQEEATDDQQSYPQPHAQGPFGVYPTDTWVGVMDFSTTSSHVAPNNKADDPSSLASRIAHRRVARTKRNLNGGLFRPDPYDDSTVDDIAALDPRLKILQSRTEYRSDASADMITTSEQLFDMRDDGACYSGIDAMG